MRRLLRVSMSTGIRGYEPLPPALADLGGRGLASALVAENMRPDADPLGPEAVLVFAPGLLTGGAITSAAGTAGIGAGRMSVSCKSPLTQRIHAANAGGMPGVHLADLGIAALVIEGKAEGGAFLELAVSPDAVRLSPATVQGLGCRDAAASLAGTYGERCSLILIGSAGETALPVAGIACADRGQRPPRHAGSGGSGAVMGSKGLKAVILVPPANNAPEEPGGENACGTCPVKRSGGCPGPAEKGRSGKWPGFERLWRPADHSAEAAAALVARFGALCDDAGVDALATARGLAVLQRAGRLQAGDAESALRLVAGMGAGTTEGRLLGAGADAIAAACGLHSGEEPPSEDDRDEDLALADTLGICRFAATALRNEPEALAGLAAAAAARCGAPPQSDWPGGGWPGGIGRRVVALEKIFNAAACGAQS
jgi:aldehyde:ferredoxin oxidoreductase